jgi:hypothetical protein
MQSNRTAAFHFGRSFGEDFLCSFARSQEPRGRNDLSSELVPGFRDGDRTQTIRTRRRSFTYTTKLHRPGFDGVTFVACDSTVPRLPDDPSYWIVSV